MSTTTAAGALRRRSARLAQEEGEAAPPHHFSLPVLEAGSVVTRANVAIGLLVVRGVDWTWVRVCGAARVTAVAQRAQET